MRRLFFFYEECEKIKAATFFSLYSQCEEKKSMQEKGRACDLRRSQFPKTQTGWVGFYAGQIEPAESTAVKLGTVYRMLVILMLASHFVFLLNTKTLLYINVNKIILYLPLVFNHHVYDVVIVRLIWYSTQKTRTESNRLT